MVRPITAEIELVRAEAEVLYRGRRQATAQAQLTDAADRQAARPRHRDLHDPRLTRPLAARSRARRTSSRTPKPVAPLPTYSRPVSQAVPAMSRCAQGTLVDELLEEGEPA